MGIFTSPVGYVLGRKQYDGSHVARKRGYSAYGGHRTLLMDNRLGLPCSASGSWCDTPAPQVWKTEAGAAKKLAELTSLKCGVATGDSEWEVMPIYATDRELEEKLVELWRTDPPARDLIINTIEETA